MRHDLCARLGMEFPLFAFSHCRDVVVAVSRAGGFGVLGGSGFTPETLEQELAWINSHIDGRPYGVDILFPEHQAVQKVEATETLLARVPQRHREFVNDLLGRYGIAYSVDEALKTIMPTTLPEIATELLDVAFRHPIKLIANALGIAPPAMIARGKEYGVPVAALVGAAEHAIRQVNAGVDIIVAQGGEAGGHCGEVSTLVVVPEVIRAVQQVRDVPVLAAGGIVTGRQMAGMMAMGAAGAWTGSVWLATMESETSETFRQKMVKATSRDTVRSRARTGKPSRQLRSAWHDAWEAPGAPDPLAMPMQAMLTRPAFRRIDAVADAGQEKAKELVSYFVGQGVGLIDSVRPAAAVVQNFKQEFADALSDLQEIAG